jgi:MFS family permease
VRAPSPENPRSYLPLIVAITSLGVLTFSLITPALPDIADELEVSRATIGWIQGAVAIPGIFLAVFIGYVYDRAGRRAVAMTSLIVFGVAGASAYFARSFWPLVAVRAIQGIGTSGILSLGVILIGDLFPAGTQRRWALGINSAGLTMTGMVSPILGGLLAEVDPFLPFVIFGLAAPLAIWARKLPGRPDGPSPAAPFQHLSETYREVRKARKLADFGGLLPFSTFSLVVFAGLGFTTVPIYLEAEFGSPARTRGLIQAALSVGSTTGALTTSRLTDRSSPATVFTAGLGLSVLGFAVLAVAPSLPIVALGLLVMGLGLGFSFPLLQDYVTSAVPGAYRGAIVGVFVMAVRLGQSFGPVLGSTMADGLGGRETFAIAGIASAIALAGWRPVRRLARRIEARHPL